eukprot:69948_1
MKKKIKSFDIFTMSSIINEHSSTLIVSGYIRKTQSNVNLCMKFEKGIISIVYSYYFIPFEEAKLWCCGKWRLTNYNGAGTVGTEMHIVSPKINEVEYPFGYVMVNDKKNKIEEWFNNYSFILYNHTHEQVFFCLSHVLYESDLDIDCDNKFFEDNIRWEIVKGEDHSNDYTKYKLWRDAKNEFRLNGSKWKHDDDTIEIIPEVSAYAGKVIYNGDANTYHKIGFWFHDMHFCMYPDNDTSFCVHFILSDSGQLYEKGRISEDVYVDNVWTRTS